MTREEAIAIAERNSQVDTNRLVLLWDTVKACESLAGGMVEVGVYKGGTAQLLRAAHPAAEFICFDTFAGHPPPSEADHANHHAGRFADTSLEAVSALFTGHPNPPRFVQGRFPDSLESVEFLGQLAFVHVDVDLYEGTLAAFERLWPLLVPGGAVVCDDYGFDDCPGAMRAVLEFVSRTPDAWLVEPATKQAVVWKAAA